ncbi:MAG: hypothetical protein M1503_05220 [Thaumarchaeota archaeon]|nr:hypothetical protein [Nitrososphaerota archaeon]MCL5317651.1 hypothetical protein [Nitrososphaerota archaeon]
METRNIIIIGVWSFSIVWLAGMLVARGDLTIAMVLFFIAIVVSIVASGLPSMQTPPQPELLTELQNIRTRMDTLSKEVEDIKKTIEE